MITAWDEYGPLRWDRDGTAPLPDGPPLLVRYARLSRQVAAMIAEAGMRERNWTRYRIASAVLAEIQSGQTWARWRRRQATGHQNGRDFLARVEPLYLRALAVAVNDRPTPIAGPHPSGRTDDQRPRTANLGGSSHAKRIAA